MNEKLIHTNYAFLTVIAKSKRIEIDIDPARTTVWTSINGRLQKWTDYTEQGEFLNDGTSANLDQCLEYLQSFQANLKGMDLNEIHHNETIKYAEA